MLRSCLKFLFSSRSFLIMPESNYWITAWKTIEQTFSSVRRWFSYQRVSFVSILGKKITAFRCLKLTYLRYIHHDCQLQRRSLQLFPSPYILSSLNNHVKRLTMLLEGKQDKKLWLTRAHFAFAAVNRNESICHHPFRSLIPKLSITHRLNGWQQLN